MYRTTLILLKGAFIGAANIIPGLSGGTVAVGLGVYDRIVGSLSRFFSGIFEKDDIYFMGKIFLGAALALIVLAEVIELLFADHYRATMFGFIGLVLGGIPAVVSVHKDMGPSLRRISAFIAGAVILAALFYLNHAGVGVHTDPAFHYTFYSVLLFSGFLAGGAMIVPGLSGSLVLLILGQYAFIIASLRNLSLLPIAVFATGAIAGIMVSSKVVAWFLRRYPSETYYLILGLIASSVVMMFPGLSDNMVENLGGLVFLASGGAVSFFLSRVP